MNPELEKCLKGEWYDCHDDIFLEYKSIADELCSKYNNTSYRNKDERTAILHELFAKVGHSVSVGTPFICDYGCHIEIGSNVTINRNCMLMDCNKIVIGNNVLIAPNVHLSTPTHPIELNERLAPTKQLDGSINYERRTYALPITIEDGCWIGANVVIIGGVTIGTGSVIGAGSVVTKSIPPNSLAVGNPCRVIRAINQDKQ